MENKLSYGPRGDAIHQQDGAFDRGRRLTAILIDPAVMNRASESEKTLKIAGRVLRYFSMIKFAHTIFAMPFALIGYFAGVVAGGGFSWRTFFLVVLCMVFARNAAMAFNRWADRHTDARNMRTLAREIPSGAIRPRAALLFVALNSLAFVAACGMLNALVLWLSPIALLVILGYSFAKHYTALCHLILGAGLSLAPTGAYLAVTGAFAWLPTLFSLTVLLWSGGFDIIYAIQDREFDLREQLHSMPARLGVRNALRVSAALHLATGILVIIAGFAGGFGILYAIGAAIFLFLLLYQHLIVHPGDFSRINAAFFTSNGAASVAFALFTIIDLLV